MQFANSAMTPDQIPSSPIRLHGLDALRGIAAILVVLLHAGVPYMTNPLPYLVWPARDVHPSSAVDGLTWCTECFLMPLFFVLAGFFSKGLLVSRGERGFLACRTKRLLWTQIAAGLVILPLCFCIWLLGWVADGLFIPKRAACLGLPYELKAELFGTAHLWFLQNLYIYCLLLCVARWLSRRFGRPEMDTSISQLKSVCVLDRLLASAWKPLVPAIPCALILYCDTRIVLGFYQTFIPVLSKLLYYSIYFFVGVALHRNRDALQMHARFGKTYLLVASVLFVVTLPLIHEHLNVPLTELRLALLAGLLALFAWFTTFGLFAIFLRTKGGDNAVVRYLADASFWIYLIHLPIVGLSQIAIAQLPVPSMAKFLLAGATALAMSLMTYSVFVRHTWLGVFLDGHRRFDRAVAYSSSSVPLSRPGYANSDRAAHSVQRAAHLIPHEG